MKIERYVIESGTYIEWADWDSFEEYAGCFPEFTVLCKGGDILYTYHAMFNEKSGQFEMFRAQKTIFNFYNIVNIFSTFYGFAPNIKDVEVVWAEGNRCSVKINGKSYDICDAEIRKC